MTESGEKLMEPDRRPLDPTASLHAAFAATPPLRWPSPERDRLWLAVQDAVCTRGRTWACAMGSTTPPGSRSPSPPSSWRDDHVPDVVPGRAHRGPVGTAAHRRRIRGPRLAHRHRPRRRIQRPDEDRLDQSGWPELASDHPPYARVTGLLPRPTPDRSPAAHGVDLGLARAADALCDGCEPHLNPPAVCAAADPLLLRSA